MILNNPDLNTENLCQPGFELVESLSLNTSTLITCPVNICRS